MTVRRIRVLNEQTINQIAAGEVIENPASVVKELIENALDAHATQITLQTLSGGRALIRVIDNGCGMAQDDLNRLSTLGFRGEALPSIASISKMRVHSASSGEGGTLLQVEGGRIESLAPSPRRPGTTIEVKSLFYNLPVRKKFQKSVGWDTSEIRKVLTKFALSYPSLEFSWENDEKTQFAFGCDEGSDERIRFFLGEEFIQGSFPVELKSEKLSLWGRVSNPSLHRPNRTGQYLFINGRSVISPWISQKILEAYGTRLSMHRYPLFVLHLNLPPSWIDVNVHPQKREVRLREEEKLAAFLSASIEKQEVCMAPAPLSFPALSETVFAFAEPKSIYRTEEPESELPLFTKVHIIGKVNHHLFVQEAKGIRLVDGMRAIERILFEALTEKSRKQPIQSLLLPIQVTLPPLIEEHLEDLNALGISIRPFGGETYLIDAIPAVLEPHEIPDLLHAYLEEGKIPMRLSKYMHRKIATHEAGAVIVEKLFRCQNPDYTPLGERIHYLLDEQALEKLYR